MPAKLQEITITYLGERLRFSNAAGDTIIGNATTGDNGDAQPVSIKSAPSCPITEDNYLEQHQSYRLFGTWQAYKNKRTLKNENQFVFQTFVKSTPHSRDGIVNYLDKAPGIGEKLAGRLYDKFNSSAVKILREQPEVASSAIDRLSYEAALDASGWLKSQQALEDCTIELMELLDRRGFRKSLAKELIRDYGNRAPEIARRAWPLMRYRGCGFKRCDQLYLDLGGKPAALKRQALSAWHSVSSNSSGDTWHFSGVAEAGVKASVGGAVVDWKKASRVATRGGLLASIWTQGRDGSPAWDGDIQWMAESRKASNEFQLARMLAEANGENGFPVTAPLLPEPITQHQITELSKATSGGSIGIFGGGPGTGKTFTVSAYIKLAAKKIGYHNICVTTFTGKASARINECLQANGVPLRSRTTHSLLGIEEFDSRDGCKFKHNESNKLPFKLIVVDETSMDDTDLLYALMAARPKNCCILFVGDVNQLPPVGHGAPLRDMINAGLPYGELEEIKRNDGGIVQACKDMRESRKFNCDGNLQHVWCGNVEKQLASVTMLLDQIRRQSDPIWDCQVLVAVNVKASPLSRIHVNRLLQAHLNSKNPAIDGSPFRIADKVVNLKNRFYPAVQDVVAERWESEIEGDVNDEISLNDNGDIYVANGEVGCVTKVEEKYFEVLLFNPRRWVRVPRGKAAAENDGDTNEDDKTGTGCDWDLAYALSVHKAQGSEFKHVIVLIDEYPGARRLCDRSWIYTAISRAKETCSLVGKVETANQMARINNIDRRKTFLRELIEQEVTKLQREQRQCLPIASDCENPSVMEELSCQT